jgi:small subunit ribosomal protein S21
MDAMETARHCEAVYDNDEVRRMIEITLGEGDRIEWALKQFRRKMLRSGLFKDMKKKRFYEKPSEARKRKEADARRRNARARRRR